MHHTKKKYKQKGRGRGKGKGKIANTRTRVITRNNNHCSPHALKNSIVPGSCFTKDAIQIITEAHNKQNPNLLIANDLSPKKKWIQLKESMSRIPTCDQETCWLKNIQLPDKEKNMIQAQLFVPPKPSEWNEKPNTWLTNFDIENVLRQYEKSYPKFSFIGPSPIDYDTKPNKTQCVCNKLCNFSMEKQLKMGKTKIGVVFNLDTHNKGGSHWVAMFIDLEDKFLFYFNSTGEKMQPQLVKFKDMIISQGKHVLGHMDFYVNTVEHQRSNTECGMYCLYFIITCLLRESDIFTAADKTTKTGLTKEQLITYFTGKNKRIPDSLVEEYREELFR
jgi:hypothetical protein